MEKKTGLDNPFSIDGDTRRVISGLCDWELQDKIYRATLDHPSAEGFRGYLSADGKEWTVTMPKKQEDEITGVCSRVLNLTQKDNEKFKLSFTSYAFPFDWHDRVVRDDGAKDVIWSSSRGKIWLNLPDLTTSLRVKQPKQDRLVIESLSTPHISIESPPDTLPVASIEQQNLPISAKKANRTIRNVGRQLLGIVGFTQKQDPIMAQIPNWNRDSLRLSRLSANQ